MKHGAGGRLGHENEICLPITSCHRYVRICTSTFICHHRGESPLVYAHRYSIVQRGGAAVQCAVHTPSDLARMPSPEAN